MARGAAATRVLVLGLVVGSTAQAQSPLPQPNIQLVANGRVNAAAAAPDGSVMIGGNFKMINGVARQNIARLQSDGTLDPNWNPGADCTVTALVVDASGAIYAGGCFSLIGGQQRHSLAKLDGNGSVDPVWNPQVDSTVLSLAVDGSGGIYAAGYFSNAGGQPRNGLAKFATSDAGEVDVNWNPNPTSATYVDIRSLTVDGNGALYVGGSFQGIGGQVRSGLAKLSSTGFGDADPLWDPNPGSSDYFELSAIAADTTGAVFVGGFFQTIGGQARDNIAKLSGSGTGEADTSWNPGTSYTVRTLAFGDAGTLYVGGSFSEIGGQTRSRVARLSTSGSGVVDTDWNPGASGGSVETIALAGNGLVVLGGDFAQVAGLTHPGLALVSTIGTAMAEASAEQPGAVGALATQPDGGLIVGGYFNRADQQPRNNILRLQADGTLDPIWNPDSSGYVSALAIDNKGDVFAGGSFGSIGGLQRYGIAKLSGSGAGAVDAGWDASPNCASGNIQLASDGTGSIIVGSCFNTIGGQPRQRIAKLSGTTAAADPTWNPGVDGDINALAIDGTGAIYAGGNFQTIGGLQRSHVAKLSGSGTGAADPGWNAAADNVVTTLAVDEAGSVYAGGYFQNIGGMQREVLAKLSGITGAANAMWNPGGCVASTLVLDGHGSLFTGGSCMQKFSTTGIGASMSWDPQPNGHVSALALGASDNIYLGGNFTTVAGQPRGGLAAVPPGELSIFANGFD